MWTLIGVLVAIVLVILVILSWSCSMAVIWIDIVGSDPTWKDKLIFTFLVFLVTGISSWGLESKVKYDLYWNTYPISQMNYVQDWKYDLVALKDSQNVSGKFSGGLFVSRGYINTDLYYYYVIQTVKGKMAQKLSSSFSFLDDTKSDVKPTILCGHYEFKDHDFWRDDFWDIRHDRVDECYLTVPKGTVKEDFDVDLQ